MTVSLKEATDKARYVKWLSDYGFAVWHGGHTVNIYTVNPRDNSKVNPADCINVGDFEKSQASLQEVKIALSGYEFPQ